MSRTYPYCRGGRYMIDTDRNATALYIYERVTAETDSLREPDGTPFVIGRPRPGDEFWSEKRQRWLPCTTRDFEPHLEYRRRCHHDEKRILGWYSRLEEDWLAANKIQPGDFLQIARTCADQQWGWQMRWTPRMADWVGRAAPYTPRLRRSSDIHPGVQLLLGEYNFGFPFFVLEVSPPTEIRPQRRLTVRNS